MLSRSISTLVLLMGLCAAAVAAEVPAKQNVSPAGLRLATFDVDATPPIGSMMAYDPVTNRWDLGLRARGIVLTGAGEPIVLCAVDWIGIANEGHDAFRTALARAAGTTFQRVSVHTLHQHDAPECDFSAENILKTAGLQPRQYDGTFQRQVLDRLEHAIRDNLPKAQPVSQMGFGEAEVKEVASNRRILGPDGKVKIVRWSSSKDPEAKSAPEGVIDPKVSLVSFWNEGTPVAVLSYYATHPQSYYRTGLPNPDFPGVARFLRQMAVPSALHVHFDGAGGNITAGKYNDGTPENRLVLAQRLADGMRRAWEATQKEPITAAGVAWTVESVSLKPAAHLSIGKLEQELKLKGTDSGATEVPLKLAYLRRIEAGRQLDLGCLTLGRGRILHMPGELFVEYQLAAKAHRPDLFVAMAAYGDYGTEYIGTAVAYEQGGYETSANATNVGPEAEPVLMAAIRKLLGNAP